MNEIDTPLPAAELDPLDLAALLCSRVCHDIIGPVFAMSSGLELIADFDDPDMRDEAMEMIQRSVRSANAKLMFSRLAFGAGRRREHAVVRERPGLGQRILAM